MNPSFSSRTACLEGWCRHIYRPPTVLLTVCSSWHLVKWAQSHVLSFIRKHTSFFVSVKVLWRKEDSRKGLGAPSHCCTSSSRGMGGWVSVQREKRAIKGAGRGALCPDDSFLKPLLYIVHFFVLFFSHTDGVGLPGPARLTAVRHSRSLWAICLPADFIILCSRLLKVYI